MNSYEGDESIVSNNEFNNDAILKNIDFNSPINNSYDIARKSILRISDKLKQKIRLD